MNTLKYQLKKLIKEELILSYRRQNPNEGSNLLSENMEPKFSTKTVSRYMTLYIEQLESLQ